MFGKASNRNVASITPSFQLEGLENRTLCSVSAVGAAIVQSASQSAIHLERFSAKAKKAKSPFLGTFVGQVDSLDGGTVSLLFRVTSISKRGQAKGTVTLNDGAGHKKTFKASGGTADNTIAVGYYKAPDSGDFSMSYDPSTNSFYNGYLISGLNGNPVVGPVSFLSKIS